MAWTEIWKGVLEAIKLPPRVSVPIVLVAAYILFAPMQWIGVLRLEWVRENGNPYLGIALLLSGTSLLYGIVSSVVPVAYNWLMNRCGLFIARRRLWQRTPEEKELLRGYLQKDSKTIILPVNDGVVMGLMNAGVLRPVTRESQYGRTPFNIEDWAWNYLKKHPAAIDLPVIKIDRKKLN